MLHCVVDFPVTSSGQGFRPDTAGTDCRCYVGRTKATGACPLMTGATLCKASWMMWLCMQVADLLADDAGLLRVGRAAAAKARSWTQMHNAARLQQLIEQACTSAPGSDVAGKA